MKYIITQKDFYLHIHNNFNEYNDVGFGSTELEIKNNIEKQLIEIAQNTSEDIKTNKLCKSGLYVCYTNFERIDKQDLFYYMVLNIMKNKYNIETLSENNILYVR